MIAAQYYSALECYRALLALGIDKRTAFRLASAYLP